jgi:hypothetical protein
MTTTTATDTAPASAITVAVPAAVAGPTGRRLVLPRARGFAAAALVAALSIPVTGAGSAIGAPHARLASTVAATDALTTPVSVGKLQV